MIRRRRRVREIPFSFDSFLDIVANVVGIIIRLILVVWVGARSYSSLQKYTQPESGDTQQEMSAREPADPLQDEVARHKQDLARAQERLLAQLRQFQEVESNLRPATEEWTQLEARGQRLDRQGREVQAALREQQASSRAVVLSSDELRRRSARLAEEIQALERSPLPKKMLRYRTPISRPVQSEEILFECSRGRVTFIDIAALLTQVRDGMEEKGKLLRTRWEVRDVTGTVGAFRLHYSIERERGLLDALGGEAGPLDGGGYRYGLSEWQLEPVAPTRGETLEAALTPDSEFRQAADGIDPQQTAVTFWVYPDSFALFRQLRDYLYERDIVIAGRPLPEGVPIASSRRGSVSRGQ